MPTLPPSDVTAESIPTILGFPAEDDEEDDEGEPSGDAAAVDAPVDGAVGVDVPPSPLALVALKRPDRFAAGALVLAGVAANVSLSLSWSAGEGPPGLSLLRRAVESLDSGVEASARSGVWPPLVVVLSGGLFVVLGLLLLVPARAHRLLGVLALLVALAAAAAVVLLLVETGWTADRFGPGMWCAVAVPVLGLVGALKAMLTAPLVTIDSAEQPV